MGWIETIPFPEWTGELGELAAMVGDVDEDRVDNIMSIQSLNPPAMAAHQAVYSSAMRGTKSLRKVDRELVAFVVSQVNDCHY
jgi:alkylhydroperoxidase family enzyme